MNSSQLENRNGITVIQLSEKYENLDETNMDSLRGLLLDAVKEASPQKVVLDLSRTNYFGSSFIELIFTTLNQLRSQSGGAFALSGLTENCREVLSVTHLDQLWNIYESIEDAIIALKFDQ